MAAFSEDIEHPFQCRDVLGKKHLVFAEKVMDVFLLESGKSLSIQRALAIMARSRAITAKKVCSSADTASRQPAEAAESSK